MASHVDFVGVLFIVWGLLTALVGLSTLALGIGAVALITSASRGGTGGEFAAGLTAAAFTTLAVIAIIWGAAHIGVGASVRRHQAGGRAPPALARLGRPAAAAVRHGARSLRAMGVAQRAGKETLRTMTNAKCKMHIENSLWI